MFNLIKNIFKYSDKTIQNKYVAAGKNFGDAVSYIYMGECIGFEKLLRKWEKLEEEYANRGYITITLADFISYGGYGESIDHLIGKKRKNELSILHAKVYRKNFLGKIKPSIDTNMLCNGHAQHGTYTLPADGVESE